MCALPEAISVHLLITGLKDSKLPMLTQWWNDLYYSLSIFFSSINLSRSSAAASKFNSAAAFFIRRAARNAKGHVIMYADNMTDSMKNAIEETKRRRKIQMAYNEEHGITPTTIQKSVRDLISISKKVAATSVISGISKPSRRRLIPTRTSKTSRRISRTISVRSSVSISECR